MIKKKNTDTLTSLLTVKDLAFDMHKSLKQSDITKFGELLHQGWLAKKKFAKNRTTDFFIGKKIHRPDLYNAIVRQWENRFPQHVERYENRILKYRYHS